MDYQKQIDRIYCRCKRWFYASVTLLLLALVLVGALRLKALIEQNQSDVLLERYAILLTMIAVPLSLRMFFVKVKSLSQSDSSINHVGTYFRLFLIRLVVLAFVMASNIVSLYFVSSRTFFLLALITWLSLWFTLPSRAEIHALVTEEPDKDI